MVTYRNTPSAVQEAQTLNASGAERRRLWAEGRSGRATIAATRDTGHRLAGNTVLELDLLVTVDDARPYPVTLRLPISGGHLAPYAVGAAYDVRVDPGDPAKLTFAA